MRTLVFRWMLTIADAQLEDSGFCLELTLICDKIGGYIEFEEILWAIIDIICQTSNFNLFHKIPLF